MYVGCLCCEVSANGNIELRQARPGERHVTKELAEGNEGGGRGVAFLVQQVRRVVRSTLAPLAVYNNDAGIESRIHNSRRQNS